MLILNSKFSDTTIWKDSELSNFLLVQERGETISKKYAIQKFHLTDKKQIRHCNKLVRKFNSTETIDRRLCHLSRPVFDNSKTFAIIEWDNGYSYLLGGGGIILYQLQSNNTWKELGVIDRWSY